MASKPPLLAAFCLAMCACTRPYDLASLRSKPMRETDLQGNGDLRDAPSPSPLTARGRRLYRDMLLMSPVEAREFSMLLPGRDREAVFIYILRSKGREAREDRWFEAGPDVPASERRLIRWYLSEYASDPRMDGERP